MPGGPPYLGEIRLFAFPFGLTVPEGWQICDGSLIQIDSHKALFAILGTAYGGDGRSPSPAGAAGRRCTSRRRRSRATRAAA